ncbi:hypothetical protein ADL29_12095 [Streptomyces chattanoogensis]|uniref:Uncharacterized protein n=1 Tax=Streptomyces chattanoogensis TaxID=66876 RepID=A0A0N1JXV2_9ACTN|nr:hypothetical protein ADL29_12095 [Streptomyces chattanoogensis]
MRQRRRRDAWVTTDRELAAIATAAIIGPLPDEPAGPGRAAGGGLLQEARTAPASAGAIVLAL